MFFKNVSKFLGKYFLKTFTNFCPCGCLHELLFSPNTTKISKSAIYNNITQITQGPLNTTRSGSCSVVNKYTIVQLLKLVNSNSFVSTMRLVSTRHYFHCKLM